MTLVEKRAHAFLEAAPARTRRRQHGHRRLRDRLPRAVALALFPLSDRRDDRPRPRAPPGRWSRRSSTRTGTGRHAARAFAYDTLVIAVGSLTNDFGTPGCEGARDRARDAGSGGALPPAAGQRVHPRARAGRAAASRTAARRDHRRRRDGRRACRGAAQHDAYAGVLRPGPHRSGQGHEADPDRGGRPDPAGVARAPVGCGDQAAREAQRATCAPRARVAEVLARRRAARERRDRSGGARRLGRRRKGARFPQGPRTDWRPTGSTSSSCCRRCRRRATRTFSPSAIAPPARGSARKARRCRRARSRRTSRRRTW